MRREELRMYFPTGGKNNAPGRESKRLELDGEKEIAEEILATLVPVLWSLPLLSLSRTPCLTAKPPITLLVWHAWSDSNEGPVFGAKFWSHSFAFMRSGTAQHGISCCNLQSRRMVVNPELANAKTESTTTFRYALYWRILVIVVEIINIHATLPGRNFTNNSLKVNRFESFFSNARTPGESDSHS